MSAIARLYAELAEDAASDIVPDGEPTRIGSAVVGLIWMALLLLAAVS